MGPLRGAGDIRKVVCSLQLAPWAWSSGERWQGSRRGLGDRVKSKRRGPGDTSVEGVTVEEDPVRRLRKNGCGLCKHLPLKPVC